MLDGSTAIPISRSSSVSSDVCLKTSNGRGVGTVLINRCQTGEEAYGALCYPVCRDGYQAIECCLCRQRGCPPEFEDDGVATCIKPAAYGRGTGFPWKGADGFSDEGMFQRCEEVYGTGNCEKSGAIVYPKCRLGFRAVGCCVCSPQCPETMTDLGTSCGKSHYGRGVGVSRLGCADDKEQDAALCYNHCNAGYHGVGPVCWQNCPNDRSYSCGIMCTTDSQSCATATADIILSAADAGINLVTGDLAETAVDIAETILKVISIKFC